MLSERVVLVLSKQYVQETWFIFEKILRQLTQMSLHNQRIMGVLLEDCDIPDTLGELYFLDTSDPDFFDVFVKRLKTGDCQDAEVDGEGKGECGGGDGGDVDDDDDNVNTIVGTPPVWGHVLVERLKSKLVMMTIVMLVVTMMMLLLLSMVIAQSSQHHPSMCLMTGR